MSQESGSADSPAKARIREWKNLRGPDFEKMDRARTVVLVACSPLEVHGPHLPVITDNLEATALGQRAAEILCERDPDLRFLWLPPIYTAADVLPHRGSVMFRSSTVTRVMSDLGRSLAVQGFRDIWVTNFHGGPRHFIPIEVACERTNRRHGTRMISVFSVLLNRLTGGESDLSSILGHLDGITAEDLRGDSHGGAIETSMMLHLLGEHVDPAYRDLAAVTVASRLAERGQAPLVKGDRPTIRELLRGFGVKLKFYENDTYTGAPSVASADLGARMIDTLAAHAADTLTEVLAGKLSPDACHSPVWKLRWLFTNRPLSAAFEKAMGYRNRVF